MNNHRGRDRAASLAYRHLCSWLHARPGQQLWGGLQADCSQGCTCTAPTAGRPTSFCKHACSAGCPHQCNQSVRNCPALLRPLCMPAACSTLWVKPARRAHRPSNAAAAMAVLVPLPSCCPVAAGIPRALSTHGKRQLFTAHTCMQCTCTQFPELHSVCGRCA